MARRVLRELVLDSFASDEREKTDGQQLANAVLCCVSLPRKGLPSALLVNPSRRLANFNANANDRLYCLLFKSVTCPAN